MLVLDYTLNLVLAVHRMGQHANRLELIAPVLIRGAMLCYATVYVAVVRTTLIETRV